MGRSERPKTTKVKRKLDMGSNDEVSSKIKKKTVIDTVAVNEGRSRQQTKVNKSNNQDNRSVNPVEKEQVKTPNGNKAKNKVTKTGKIPNSGNKARK